MAIFKRKDKSNESIDGIKTEHEVFSHDFKTMTGNNKKIIYIFYVLFGIFLVGVILILYQQ
jgi:hypothetical protein